jgi:hypothetical protein
MNEVTTSEAPAQRRLLPILIVVATLTATSWACATTLERSQYGAADALDGSSSSAEVGAPADRLDRSFTEQNGR